MTRPFRRFQEDPHNPYRLGRHQIPDAFEPAKAAAPRQTPIRTVTHTEHVPCFNQGDLGSCTANAALGCLVTEPFWHKGVAFTEDDAVELYKLETQLDDTQIPGEYPPDDTGSTGAWSMQALEKLGQIRSHVHTCNVHTALQLLNDGPISIGVTWFNSMFEPSGDAISVDLDSGVGGGHQVCLVANNAEKQRALVRNSWGEDWGRDGHAWLAWSDLAVLFYLGGDAVQPKE